MEVSRETGMSPIGQRMAAFWAADGRMIDCVCVETDEAVAILAPVAETTDIRISTVLGVHRTKTRFTASHYSARCRVNQ